MTSHTGLTVMLECKCRTEKKWTAGKNADARQTFLRMPAFTYDLIFQHHTVYNNNNTCSNAPPSVCTCSMDEAKQVLTNMSKSRKSAYFHHVFANNIFWYI
jgi:hypothetical protein